MKTQAPSTLAALLLAALFLLVQSLNIYAEQSSHEHHEPGSALHMDLYKTESCGCCKLWQEHLESFGYSVDVHHPDDMAKVKKELLVPPAYQSCHTGVVGGFVFEGHVPEKFVKQFLANPPEQAVGLTVPGMPLGSPGMEVGERFTPYDILLIKKDGSVETYAQIKTVADQH